MLGVNSSIDIQDILYGGFAGELPLPEVIDADNILVSDSKLSQPPETSPEPPDVLSFPEAIASAIKDEKLDIRPRIYDGITKEWILLDTGSQCSVTKASPDDVARPDLLLETVDGSEIRLW